MAAKKTKKSTAVESVEHQDKRVNIPTDRQTHLVGEDETTELRYQRDPSLDPQLVWKGKDELDGVDLVVPALPIFIQEKIDPRVLVENLRATAKEGELEPELTLFDDFDGTEELDALQRVEFYQHEGNWQNRMILGDSLVVMSSLAEREGLRGRVQAIYVDPPYGIKYGSNWQVSTRRRDVKDGTANDATREPEVVRAFRDTWRLGINTYLTYLRDRLVVGRDLLLDSGSLFVQIGDENVHLVRSLMDEVFGSENFVAQINFQSRTPLSSGQLESTYDYIIWYAKNRDEVKFRNLWVPKDFTSSEFRFIDDSSHEDGYRTLNDQDALRIRGGDTAGLFKRSDFASSGYTASCTFPLELKGLTYTSSKSWRTNREGTDRLIAADRLFVLGKRPYFKLYADDFPFMTATNSWSDTVSGDSRVYVVQTSRKVVERCLLMATDPGDLVVDPTCGSGTTALLAEHWGRRWITIDTSRVALSLARTRLMSAKFRYFYLADSPEGAKIEAHQRGEEPPGNSYQFDVRRGFVNHRVPHVTLKSIAQNPDIASGMDLEEIRSAIARNAEFEILVDNPAEDKARVRVAGRFTVESLSPHRMLDVAGSQDRPEGGDSVRFETMILENLLKAGVQNTYKDERLTFDRLEPMGGEWLQAEGEYTEGDGTVRRVAVSIGPEYGTVGADQVALAAQEATRGIPYDLLLVTGFAFDPNAWATAKEIDSDTAERKVGRLQTLLVRANADLSMGDELLKKTGAGNLFVVFGEPDIDITNTEGQITVEIKGLDVYDPTTGQVRSSSTDDLAAWFIDTNYDGTSFFVRHAYFTGGQKPYESLAKTLRSEIDAEAWATIYSTVSRPFDPPETGKIAVKIINHYGDEVLQVYEVAE